MTCLEPPQFVIHSQGGVSKFRKYLGQITIEYPSQSGRGCLGWPTVKITRRIPQQKRAYNVHSVLSRVCLRPAVSVSCVWADYWKIERQYCRYIRGWGYTNEATKSNSSPHLRRNKIRGKPDRNLIPSRHNPLSAKDIFGLESGTILCPGRKLLNKIECRGGEKRGPCLPAPCCA